ncbi:hypothetical protein PG993_013177 [Apiospora rasikravindrae]|uniref:EthD domain-containing protein n=1 Tax=Apiospora rasikravindrae TaxID=990691 RepID=A0ABR1RWW4_9PEZI
MSDSATHYKFTVTHYRRPEHTHEAFMKWIVAEHLPAAMPIFKKHGVLEYSLFETPAPLNSMLKETLSKTRAGWDCVDFDCFIEYVLPSVETMHAVTADPDCPAALKGEDKWLDTSRALASMGRITPYLLRTGELVNMAK